LLVIALADDDERRRHCGNFWSRHHCCYRLFISSTSCCLCLEIAEAEYESFPILFLCSDTGLLGLCAIISVIRFYCLPLRRT